MSDPLHAAGPPAAIDLHSGDSALRLSPATGGSIVSWRWRGADIFRPTTDTEAAGGNPRELGGFPMIPFSGRISRGRFTVDGQDFQLDRNFGDSPHSIHGVAWQRPWTVAEQTEEHARLTWTHDPAGNGGRSWPFAFAAELDYALSGDTLRVAVTLQNTDSRAWPAGMGLHPYFPRDPDTMLGFAATGVWMADTDSIPVTHEPVPSEWRFDPVRTLGEPQLDNCFTGWGGEATLIWPSRGMRLTISAVAPLGHLVVFVPPGRDFFAVEPASHMPDAINHLDDPGNGLRRLASGELLTAITVFRAGPA